jgi:hypothetical protein
MSNDFIYPDGLVESTEQDLQVFDECFSSAIPSSLLWKDLDNTPKFVQWDTDWVEYLQHRKILIDTDGRTEYFPWKIYAERALKWANGYAPSQGNLGSCCLFGHTNSLITSNLTNSVRTGKPAPEINSSITYAVARGNGTPRWGSGLNLIPMSKWAAEIGNYLVSDVGAYDTAGTALKKDTATAKKNALKYQSIIIYVPGKNNTPSFDDVFLACSAGFGVAMGTGTYPTASKVGSSGLSEPTSWKNGGHAMCFAAAVWHNGKRYLYLLNSHGYRYDGDKYFDGKQPGCWISEENFARIANGAYRYGNWYVNIGEIG